MKIAPSRENEGAIFALFITENVQKPQQAVKHVVRFASKKPCGQRMGQTCGQRAFFEV